MEVRQSNDPPPNSGFPVSGRQQNTYYSDVNDKLEEFVKCFVEEFEAKLLAYHLFLKGVEQKAGKISDTLSERLGQVFGGATGALIGFLIGLPKEGAKAGAKAGEKVGKKVGSMVGNAYHKKEVTKLLDLIAFSQKDKNDLRRVVVEAGFDVFQSFEMQFMRVTTDQGPETAIEHLAKDATNRAISYMKENKDKSISESVILGISKKQKLDSISRGYTIQYEYHSNKKQWDTASLFEKAGIVIEDKTSKYYKKKQEKSETTKYGYRRLLSKENWNKLKEKYDSDDTVDSNSVQFTDYQYIVDPKCLEEQITHILGKLNSNDPNLGEDRIKKILKEVRNDILLEMDVLKEQFHEFIEEDRKKLSSIEDSIKNFGIDKYLKKFEQYFVEAQQARQLIAHSIEEGREENRKRYNAIQKSLGEIKCALKHTQETQTEGIISGLGITKYYYMSRTLIRHIQIRDDFEEDKNTFFVTRSSQIDNSKLQKNQNIVIISDTRIDFEKLCKEYKEYNIHWLKEKESKLIWQYSQGSLSELRKFVGNKKIQISKVNKISCINDKVVIISAGPGMGKSTLLTHLAAEQKKFSSTLKVIRVNLKDHTDKVSGEDFEITNKILEFLRAVTGVSVLDLKKSIFLFDGFDEIYSNTDYKDKVTKLVRFLKHEAKNVWVTTRPYAQYDLEDKLNVFSYTLEPLSKVTQKEFLDKYWKIMIIYDIIKEFTLRIDSEIEDVEIESLASKVSKVIGLFIGELKDYDDNLMQIKSLTSEFNLSEKENIVKKITALIDKELGKHHKVSKKVKVIVEKVIGAPNLKKIRDLIEIRAEIYAKELIVKFCKSVSDKEREFTGVPLQLRMLAEAFQEDFYEDFKKWNDLKPNQRALDKPKLPARFSLLDLYERFIENKYSINFIEKGNIDLTIEFNKNLYNALREPFMYEHRLLALNFLFAEEDWKNIISEEEKNKIKEFKKEIGLGIKNTGIVYQINNEPHFVHRTFAEYFAADFFVDRLLRKRDHPENKQVRDILSECIFKAGNEVIRNFFDRMLAKDKESQNQYEIHTAVLNNDIHMIKNIISDSQKAELIINSLDKGERTALHLAAAYGYLDIVEVLLEQPVKINTKDQIFAWSPLSYADKNSYWDIAELLLQNDASFEDMFEAKKNVNTCYKGKRTLLHIAAQEGYIQFVKVLVDKLNADFRATDSYNNIPLHLAANYGKLEIVEFLLNKDRVTARSKDYSGKTPLDLAVYRGQLKVVDYLGKKLGLGKKELDEMQLNAAASNGKYKIVDNFLKEGVGVNSEVLGWTPLHQAAKAGNLKVVQLLVQNGANILHRGNNHPDPNVNYGWTPLHGAANKGHYDIVKYLVEELLKKGADINPANNEGYTPLHTAARGGHLSVVKYFIEELGENKVYKNISDKKGTTPLHAAAFHGKYNIVQYLVEQDANISAVDSWGATVVFSAACYNDHNIINLLLERNAIIDASEGVIGRLGITVLHVAAMYGASEIAKSLVEDKKIDLNAQKNSFTPLHLAVLSDSFSTIKYLINEGAQVDAVVNFSNIAKILKDEENVFKDTSMNTIVQKLIKFCSYLDYMVNLTPCDIYKLLKFNNKETLELLEQKDRGLLYGCCNAIKNFAGSILRENYFKEQINELKVFISEKKSGDLYLLEQHFLDPPQESHL